jgi:hypothetical protein
MKKMLIILPFLLLAMAGCQKEKEEPKPTVSDLLIAGDWKPLASGIDQNGNHAVDAGETLNADACDADNTYDYVAGGTLIIKDNALQCDPDYPEDDNLTWSLSDNDTVLKWTWTLPGFSYSMTLKILSIDANRLVLAMEESGVDYFIVFGK